MLTGEAMSHSGCLKYRSCFHYHYSDESTILVAAACTASGGVSACLSRLVTCDWLEHEHAQALENSERPLSLRPLPYPSIG